MKKITLLLFCLVALVLETEAQGVQVKGIVRDTAGFPLPGTLVNLQSAQQKMATAVDVTGSFYFSGITDSLITLNLRFMGYDSLSKSFSIDQTQAVNNLGVIKLHETSNVLNEVVVVAVNPVVLKEDTVEYDARAYPVRDGDAVEEIVKKLPGVDVDKDGNVLANGEPITSIRLDGKEYFGDDVATALQNLPADIVKNLQIIDDYGEQANITGLKSGAPEKVLNINLKPDKKKGYFAKATAGLGNENRYSGRVRANYLNGTQQTAFEGNMNNTRSRSAGVTDNKSVKLNYRDNWGEKLVSYGSYRFNNNDNNTIQTTNSQNFFPNYTRLENQDDNSESQSNQHRLFWNFEFRPDTNNYFKIEPNLGFATNRGFNTGLTTTQLLDASSKRQNSQSSSERSFDLELETFYNHRFRKAKRNLSFSFDVDRSAGNGNRDVQNDYTNIDSLGGITTEQQYQTADNNNTNTNLRFHTSYIEPLGKYSYLELAYRWNRSSNANLKETRDIDPTDQSETLNNNLSNDYDYHFTTNRFGLNYRLKNEKINSTIGLFAQPSVLSGTDFSRDIDTYQKNFNWVPSLRFAYEFSREKRLTLNYQGNSNQPGFRQLQPVTDNSNLQNTVTGNPNLKPEFAHQTKVEYRQTNVRSGTSLYGNIDYNRVQDKIVTTKNIVTDSLKQETSYINTDGFYNANGNYAVSFPLSGERKFVLTYFGGSNYSHNIAFTNNERIIGKNIGLQQGFKFRVDISDVMDSEVKTSYAYSNASFSAATIEDRSSSQINVQLEGRSYFFKDFTLGYNFSKTFNKGYNASIGNPTFLNVYMEHRFLKGNKGSVRLQGFDLFGQNTGIRRDIFDNEIVDRQSNRLSTYFLLSFNYRFQQFGG